MIKHLNNPEAVAKFTKAINKIIVRRPELDLEKFTILNDNLHEVCNNRVSYTDINVKSLLKEIQNHVITIFDGYKTAIESMKQYKNLLSKIKNYQHEVYKKCNYTKDLNKITSIFTKKIELFLKLDDNFDLIGDIDQQIEDSLEHICENLIDYETIDKLTFTDEVVEENKKLLLNSMIVKYAHRDKNIS
jgi:hypothetical protein